MSSTQQKPTVKSENFRNISEQVLRFVCVSQVVMLFSSFDKFCNERG